MKHLLIIISILLLSSPVIGDNHKGETLYGWGKCCDYVWKGFGEKDTNPKYKGEVENGVPNGFGFL
ncbi:MAG: cytoplasmic protein, partial [SAR324 cluster bacterium]|nr:cytoplasmic protein [SAR324 cluster bacterium]